MPKDTNACLIPGMQTLITPDIVINEYVKVRVVRTAVCTYKLGGAERTLPTGELAWCKFHSNPTLYVVIVDGRRAGSWLSKALAVKQAKAVAALT